MPKVKLLDRETYEIIAAGEVIERPASVVKELIENSVDSGANHITVEIKQGGTSYIRVTDDGCGIDGEDVPVAFLRHATSKISEKEDLDNIRTLGFRGEALASICAVSRVEVMTKTEGSEFGFRYLIEGANETESGECGCRNGTTVVVRDIFYNIPARLKFLKKNISEGNAVQDITGKIALSHPEISFKFIRDNNEVFITPGDKSLFSSARAVLGKQFAASLIPVDYSLNGIQIDGFIAKPLFCRPKRTHQYFFINGRYVKSFACISALEEAYKNVIMEGKFPACILRLSAPPNIMDVNVHPAKIEIRFTDEHIIYDAVFFAVKNAVLMDSEPAPLKIPENAKTKEFYTSKPFFEEPGQYVQTSISIKEPAKISVDISPEDDPEEKVFHRADADIYSNSNIISGNSAEEQFVPIEELNDQLIPAGKNLSFAHITAFLSGYSANPPTDAVYEENCAKPGTVNFRLIGEAFKNYIIAELEDEIIIADKHAAHERIIFERLKAEKQAPQCQLLLNPEEVILGAEVSACLSENKKLCEDMGFDFDIREHGTVAVSGIPAVLDGCDPKDVMAETAHNIYENRRNPLPDIIDDIRHTIACKAAIKANDITSREELSEIMRILLTDEKIRYCPHGRPIMFKITKRDLEKNFRRI